MSATRPVPSHLNRFVVEPGELALCANVLDRCYPTLLPDLLTVAVMTKIEMAMELLAYLDQYGDGDVIPFFDERREPLRDYRKIILRTHHAMQAAVLRARRPALVLCCDGRLLRPQESVYWYRPPDAT